MLFKLFYGFIFLFLSATVLASPLPLPLIIARQEKVSNVQCTGGAALDFHEVNVAQLQICGSIAGAIQKCQGSPTSTTGEFGGAKFTINPVVAGDTINISKGRWEQGIKAAFAVCGQDAPFTATFAGGATKGDVNVKLEAA